MAAGVSRGLSAGAAAGADADAGAADAAAGGAVTMLWPVRESASSALAIFSSELAAISGVNLALHAPERLTAGRPAAAAARPGHPAEYPCAIKSARLMTSRCRRSPPPSAAGGGGTSGKSGGISMRTARGSALTILSQGLALHLLRNSLSYLLPASSLLTLRAVKMPRSFKRNISSLASLTPMKIASSQRSSTRAGGLAVSGTL